MKLPDFQVVVLWIQIGPCGGSKLNYKGRSVFLTSVEFEFLVFYFVLDRIQTLCGGFLYKRYGKRVPVSN